MTAWEKGAPSMWIQGEFEKGWEEKIACHKWLWEIHTKSEMDVQEQVSGVELGSSEIR